MTTLEQKARDLLGRIGVPNPHDYTAGELVELANLMAATPAWEPLTPERLAALHGEPSHTRYWVARVGGNAPAIGHTLRFGNQVCFGVNASILYATEVTHIMPFKTPEMPS